MVSRKDLLDRASEVTELAKWWATRRNWRYHQIRKLGSMEDFTNDVWVGLLKNFSDPDKNVEVSFSTVVVKHCEWQLCSSARMGTIASRSFREKLRQAESVQADNIVTDDSEIIAQCDDKALKQSIAKLMLSLTWREAAVIRARFGLFGDDSLTLEAIGKILNVSRERVRSIESKALGKIQNCFNRSIKLLPFFDEICREAEQEKNQEKRNLLYRNIFLHGRSE